MPTYEYTCDACGAEFEREQRISEKPVKKCPECGKAKARRMISGGGNFVLKGGGWYNDLYSGPSNKKADDKTAKPDKSEAAPEAKGTDRPESKGADKKTESKGTDKKPDKKPSGTAAA
ncbi:MAG: FmdB family zinc ribbon protein [Myxococcota bacterium]